MTDVSGPAWLAAGFAVLMIMIAACRACRPAISRLRGKRTELGTDGLHVLMGIAMAGMLQPRLALVPGPVWSGVFAAGAAWFAWQAAPAARRAGQAHRARCAHPGPHAIECAAMVYMLVPVGSWPSGRGEQMAMGSMSPGAAAGNPALTLILALLMLGYALWAADQAHLPVMGPGCRVRRQLRGYAHNRLSPARPSPPASQPATRSPWPAPWATCSSRCSSRGQETNRCSRNCSPSGSYTKNCARTSNRALKSPLQEGQAFPLTPS